MTSATAHATRRIRERVGKQAARQAVEFFEYLWKRGRPANRGDFNRFNAQLHDYHQYRVCVCKAGVFLVAYDAKRERFLTLWKL